MTTPEAPAASERPLLVATVKRDGLPQFGFATVLVRWEAGADALPIGTHKVYAASAPQATEAERVCYQAYQVVGSLLSDLGKFNTPEAERILDNLSQAKMVHDNVLPWDSYEVADAPAASEREVLQQALAALETAHTGLMWYRGMMPEYVDGSDHEADEEITAAREALRAHLSTALTGAAKEYN